MATSGVREDVEGIETITTRLTQTNLAEDNTRPAIKPPAREPEMRAITDRICQFGLEESSIEREADDEEDEDSLFLPEGPISEEVRQTQAAEAAAKAAAAQQQEEDEKNSASLSVAIDMWSIDNSEEAKAKREARRIQDRLKQDHTNRMEALKIAEASRLADANHASAWKKWMEDKAQARLTKANHEAQEAEGEDAGKKLAEANSLATQHALQKEALEREWEEDARSNKVKEEADNKLREELSRAHDNAIAALNAANTEAKIREWQSWQQQQAQSLARNDASFPGLAENATVNQQQQQANCFFFDDMEIASDEEAYESTFTAMDMTSNTEGVGEESIEWEPVGEVLPLPAQARLPIVPLTDPVVSSAGNSISGSCLDSLMPDAETICRGMATSAVAGNITASPQEARPNSSTGQKKAQIPTAASDKKGILKAMRKKGLARSKAKRASSLRCSGQAATVVSAVASASDLAKQIRFPSFREALKALRTGSPTPASPPSLVLSPLPASPSIHAAPPPLAAAPSPSPPSSSPSPEPLPLPTPQPSQPPAPLALPLPQASPPPAPLTLPPPLAPAFLPFPPTRKVLKVALARRIRPVTRLTIHPSSPLGRLLSRGKSLPQVAQKQVLGKRKRANQGEVGPEMKKAKLNGEFQHLVRWKRKRENETFSSKKRANLGRALNVPCSRFVASQKISSPNCVVPAPILTPTSALVIGPALETPRKPQLQSPITAVSLQVNLSSSLAETIAFVDDLPALRAEIAWMRSYRTIHKKTRGKKKVPTDRIIELTSTGYWEKYRENEHEVGEPRGVREEAGPKYKVTAHRNQQPSFARK